VEIVKPLLIVREYDKLLSTYVTAFKSIVNPVTRRIHTNLRTYGAETGRFSSNSPNLQNVPSHHYEVRQMFVPQEGHLFISADFSAQEPRIAAHLSNDQRMIKAYGEGKDLYAVIASIIYDTTYEECLENKDGKFYKAGKERRSTAKWVMLGIMYSKGVSSLAVDLGVTKDKAEKIYNKVLTEFPGLKKLIADSEQTAKTRGFVETIIGRRRNLPEMQLKELEIEPGPGYKSVTTEAFDPTDFESQVEVSSDLTPLVRRKWATAMKKAWGAERHRVIAAAKAENIIIRDNGGKIAQASRATLNSRVQGSAADACKIAIIKLHRSEELKELGCRMLLPIHDELLFECPVENVPKASIIIKDIMEHCVDRWWNVPNVVDIVVTDRWAGEELEIA
jgi:DNA polymerase-1